MLRKARKIRDRLDADYGLGMLASRPRGMHWKTFFRLEEKLADLESVALLLMREESLRSFRPGALNVRR